MNSRQVEIHARRSLLILGALALAAAGLSLFQSRYGPGTTGDSTSYLMGADNLLLGNGFSRYSGGYEVRPITGFPPFYSVVLAGLRATGMDLFTVSRGWNALFFAGNAFLTGFLIFRYTRSTWPAILGAGAVVLQPDQFHLHTWVMSEPLYTVLSLSVLWLVAGALPFGSWRRIVLAGGLAAAAVLTRYIGFGLVAAAVIALLITGSKDWRGRLARALAFSLLALVPLALWLKRNVAESDSLVNREVGWRTLNPDLALRYLAELSSWFVPHEWPLPTMLRATLALALVVIVLGGFFWHHARRGLEWDRSRIVLSMGRQDLAVLPWLIVLYDVFYLIVLVLNSLLLDAGTTLGAPARYLAPFFVVNVVLLASAGFHWAQGWIVRPAARALSAFYLLLLLASYGAQTMDQLRDPLGAIGYTGYRYRWTEVREAILSLDRSQPVVSNNPEIIYILADRPAYVRPIRYDSYRQAPRTDYEEQMEAAADQLNRRGILVVIKPLEDDDQAVIERLALDLLLDLPQASIYGHARLEPIGRR